MNSKRISRVLHVLGSVGIGGAETFVMNLYRNIDRSIVQFDFLLHFHEEKSYEKEIKDLGGRIFYIPHITEVGYLRYRKALADFFREHPGYNIIHSHINETSEIVLKEAKKSGIPIRIAHSHSSYPKYNLIVKIIKGLLKFQLTHNATHYFACGERAAKWLFGKKNVSNVKIVRNGIDIDKFANDNNEVSELRTQLGIKDGTLVIGNVGRFNPPKNHDYMIDVFAEVKEVNNDSVLLLADDGSLRGRIEEKASRLGLKDSIKFLGIRDDIHVILKLFDVFIMPSLYEGFPVTLIEAQASGLMCIVSDRISREVDLGLGLLEFLPLGKKYIDDWARKVALSGKRKKNTINESVIREFDIKEIAFEIQSFYIAKQSESEDGNVS